MHSLDVESISHQFGCSWALSEVDVSVEGGEILALLGRWRCGKTTLLRIIAGFVKQSRGTVRTDAAAIDYLNPNRRNSGIEFQNHALFPHMSVYINVAFGLAASGLSNKGIKAGVTKCLEIVQLPHVVDRFPKQLSGRQQQQVALARAIATLPQILLLDEPFGALDQSLRLDMQMEIKRLQRQLGSTAILVTHEQEEAVSIAARIAVMNKGRIEQIGSPTEIYDDPSTAFGNTTLLRGTVSSVAHHHDAVIDLREEKFDWASLSTSFGSRGGLIQKPLGPQRRSHAGQRVPVSEQLTAGRLIALVVLDNDLMWRIATAFVRWVNRHPVKRIASHIGVDAIDRLGAVASGLELRLELHVGHHAGAQVIEGQGSAGIKRSGNPAQNLNQILPKFSSDLPVSRGARARQRVARDRGGMQVHAREPMRLQSQIQFDVTQRYPIGLPSKHLHYKPIETPEVFSHLVRSVAIDAPIKACRWWQSAQRRRNEFALTQDCPLRSDASGYYSWRRPSSQHQATLPKPKYFINPQRSDMRTLKLLCAA